MIKKSQGLTLHELIDIYEGQEVQNNEEQRSKMLLLMLTHEEIKPCLKNQSQLLKRIFTYRHLQTLIEFLKEQNPEHAEQLRGHKFDPSGQNIPLCLKLPFMAMEILCCECHHINDILFTGSAQNPSPLLPKLLQFLDHPQHYHLACYFSKVISAITKRVSSTSHKFNGFFSKCVFGENEEEESMKNSALFKAIKHFYSLSTFDYITKWLLLSTKETVMVEEDDQAKEKTIVSFKKPLKMKFLQELLNIVNKNTLDQEAMSNISALFEQMLTNPSKAKKIPGLSIKAFGSNLQQPKTTLYDLAAREEIISEVFEVPDQGCLTLAKLALIKVYISRYILELESLKKQKSQEEEQERKLLQIINADNFMYLFEWIVEHLKIYLKLTTRDISSQNSAHIEEQTIKGSRVVLSSVDKMLVLQMCELMRIIHGLESCKFQLIEYYNEHGSSLVSLITRLMSLENNLIHLETSKIVLSMIKTSGKGVDANMPYDFARKLLSHSIMQLIQISSVKAHVIEWADILLSLETEHIFEDCEEEFEWQHVKEIVEEAKQIHVGQFRMVQAHIDCFYSEEKARIRYSHFLDDHTAQIQYQEKKESKLAMEKKLTKQTSEKTESQRSLTTDSKLAKHSSEGNDKIQGLKEDGQSNEANLFFLSDLGSKYLKYDVDDLIQEL